MTSLQTKLGFGFVMGGSFIAGAVLGYSKGKGIATSGLEDFALTYAPVPVGALIGAQIELSKESNRGPFEGLGALFGGAAGGATSFVSQGAGYLAGYTLGGVLK
ncbi:hypothetical protein HY837_02675 [archaeon]|nr:hypothetical protein [archaeon]